MFFQRNYYVTSSDKVDILIVTFDAKRAIQESGIQNGLVNLLVTVPTAGLVLMEQDNKMLENLKNHIIQIIPDPEKKQARPQRRSGGGYESSYLRSALLSASLSLPVKDGKLAIGAQQEIILLDFDDKIGRREISISVLGE